MTHTRLKKALIKQNESLVTFPEMEGHMSHGGAFKIVRFGSIPFKASKEVKTESKEPSEVPVVFSAHRGKSADANSLKLAVSAQELLFQKKVPIDFVLPCLHASSDGKQITPKGAYDLHQWCEINKKLLGFESIRELIGMVCLGAYDLHSNAIAHRDIKRNNFFIFPTSDVTTPIIMLGDLDSIVEVNAKGMPIGELVPISPDKPPFELMMATEDFILSFEENDFTKFQEATINFRKLNFKAIDCFALGGIIADIFYLLINTHNLSATFSEDEKSYVANFQDLVKGLKDVLGADRLTMDDVLKHVFFGKTEEERATFFAKLRERAQNNILRVNGETLSRRHVDDASFIILDHSVKKVYQTSWRLAEIMEEAPRLLSPVDSYSKLLAHITLVAWLQKEIEKLKSDAMPDIHEALASDLEQFINTDKLLLQASYTNKKEIKPYEICIPQLKKEFDELQAQLQELKRKREERSIEKPAEATDISIKAVSFFGPALESTKLDVKVAVQSLLNVAM